LQLTPQEFVLLEYLCRNAGRVVTRSMILDQVWACAFSRIPTWWMFTSIGCVVRSMARAAANDSNTARCGLCPQRPLSLSCTALLGASRCGDSRLCLWDHAVFVFLHRLLPTTSSDAVTHGCQERSRCSAMWLSERRRTLSTIGSLEKCGVGRQGSAEQAALGEQL